MTAEEMRQIAVWLEASELDLLELTTPRMRLRLKRGRHAVAASGAPPMPAMAPSCLEARGTGIFLPAHAWRDAPLVQPGQRVRAGEVVALLRIGPLLQPVTATADGTVGRCLVTPGALVGFGTPLMEFTLDASQDRSTS